MVEGRILSSQEDRQTRPQPDTDEQTPDPVEPDEDSIAQAAQVSADAAAFLDDLDGSLADMVHEALTSALFEPGEVVTPAEFDLRAEQMYKGFQQKGGQ